MLLRGAGREREREKEGGGVGTVPHVEANHFAKDAVCCVGPIFENEHVWILTRVCI
jgi:hypothetical protein